MNHPPTQHHPHLCKRPGKRLDERTSRFSPSNGAYQIPRLSSHRKKQTVEKENFPSFQFSLTVQPRPCAWTSSCVCGGRTCGGPWLRAQGPPACGGRTCAAPLAQGTGASCVRRQEVWGRPWLSARGPSTHRAPTSASHCPLARPPLHDRHAGRQTGENPKEKGLGDSTTQASKPSCAPGTCRQHPARTCPQDGGNTGFH